MYCIKCGRPLKDNDMFCGYCGTRRFEGEEKENEVEKENAFQTGYVKPVPMNEVWIPSVFNREEQEETTVLNQRRFSGETTVLGHENSGEEEIVLQLIEESSGKVIEFPKRSKISVGRNTGNDLLLTDSLISGYHASFEWTDGEWLLFDESRNGTQINGVMMERGRGYALQAGDKISFATQINYEYLESGLIKDIYISPYEGITDGNQIMDIISANITEARFGNEMAIQAVAEGVLKMPLYISVAPEVIKSQGTCDFMVRPAFTETEETVVIEAFISKVDFAASTAESVVSAEPDHVKQILSSLKADILLNPAGDRAIRIPYYVLSSFLD